MPKKFKKAAAATTAALMLGPLAACGGTAGASHADTFCSRGAQRVQPGEVVRHDVLLVGNVANAPSWTLTPQQADALLATIDANGRVDVISTAGDGYVCGAESLRFKEIKDGINAKARKKLLMQNLKKIEKEMAAAPRDNGQDAFAALHLADAALASVDADQKTLYVITNGLNDHGLLDFTTEGALGADPGETLEYLKSRGSLPMFTDTRVVASGFGYTAAPQAPLSHAQRQSVADTYHAIFLASTTDVVMDPAATNAEPIDTLGKTVEPVVVTAEQRPALCTTSTMVFDQTSAVRFHGDSTEFLDPDAASAALAPVAQWLTDDSTRTVDILGTTARATPENQQISLGQSRARVVRDLLLARGVKAHQITSVASRGSYFDAYVNDQAPDGELIPAAAAKNRSVRLTLVDHC